MCILDYFKDFFACGPFFKKFLLNLLQHCFCFFMFYFFGLEARGILALWLGIKLVLPKLEGEVLTTRLPKWKWKWKSHSRVRLFATPWTATHQASLSITNPWSLFKLMSIESVMPSNYLILCHPLLQSFPATGSFPMSQFFASSGWSIGASVSALVFPSSYPPYRNTILLF